ncbi:hypothetical protein [Polaromonas eurypsychrophila]|uniref:Uncharacterized protein n=1 Tax=Polaromonas eurypsychrophila TaxID=1614635 RepID=A0A916S8S4_9BURK|nr:hypothetical protein [Polaromonas eurypsychrophila]GGA89680.1 hypothetical protein GCM10011496_08130 [Polaromonas eurypsychrophila]
MPELRTNYEGWAGKPFELVAVATDKRVQDVVDYECIISRIVPTKQQFVQLWMGDSSHRDNLGGHAQLPAGYLIDKSGKIGERYVEPHPAGSLGPYCRLALRCEQVPFGWPEFFVRKPAWAGLSFNQSEISSAG